MSDPLVDGGISGTVTVRTWQGLYIAPKTTIVGTDAHPDYNQQSYNWEILPSRHGGYWLRAYFAPGIPATLNYYYWMTNMKDQERRLVLHPGNDDWETYFFERHPSGQGYAIRSYGSNRYVCAEPDSHSVHLLANRTAAAQWERFDVSIIQIGLPGHPPPPAIKRLPFNCPNCQVQLGICAGNTLGRRCLYIHDDSGNWRCPNCNHAYVEISHLHTAT